jgi:peptidyl-dipeptidase Dcp
MSHANRNPLLEKSTLPHEAFPFDRLQKSHFKPALTAAIQESKRRLDEIRQATAPVTFANTILALECASEPVGKVASVFFNLLGAESDDELQALALEISPQLADFSSDILLDSGIFARVKSVWDKRAELGLHGEDLRLAEKTYKDFVRNGGLLNSEQKSQLRTIDQELAKISPEFGDNIRKAVNDWKMWIDNKSDLKGLPEAAVEAAAAAASEAGQPGKWLITMQYPSFQPFITYAENSSLREKLWRAYNSRAYRDQYSNENLTKEFAKLRYERARLLGFDNHAQFVLEERMAETPAKVVSFLNRLLEKAKPAALREMEEVRALKKQVTGQDTLMPWDVSFWSEKLKIKTYDFDSEVLRPYFKLENVVAGVFEHAKKLYDLQFKEATGIPAYHPDVKVFEVYESSGNKRFIGLFYADFFPRPGKQGGAWASSLRDQGFQNGKVERPHATIVCNFTKPTPTKPSLLSLDEVRTIFHEFGHALHTLLSDCRYVSIGGTNVYWDFVELPSQIMENWAIEDEGLDLFAKHYQTGEKIPRDLTAKIRKSSKFQAGLMTMRQLTFALLDMAWYDSDPSTVTDIDAFEKKITAPTTLLPRIEGTNISCSFSHIFAGGYSAGYYSYKWAEVLDADAFELFKQKGIFDRATARSFRENVLSRGGSKHPMELYKAFRGREPDPDALLRRDGLI